MFCFKKLEPLKKFRKILVPVKHGQVYIVPTFFNYRQEEYSKINTSKMEKQLLNGKWNSVRPTQV